MKNIEKYIHGIVEPFPFVRIPLVALYQRICSIVPTKDYQFSEVIYRPGYFFGFHDKCPWSRDNKRILAHRFDTGRPLDRIEKEAIEIGYFEDSSLNDFRTLGTTHAWNWQQGSRLQWLEDSDNIIYNDIVDGKSIAKIVDLEGRIIKTIPCHIVDTSNDGKMALSYCYGQLGRGMKGYGYSPLDNKPECNLSVINLETGIKTELFSHDDIVNQSSFKNVRKTHNFFFCCRFSPNGQRFSFYHRRLFTTGEVKTSLYSSNIRGTDLFLFPGEKFTHMTWRDDKTIFTYFKPFDDEMGFYLVKDLDGSTVRVGENCLTSDGHPQISEDKRYILIDTYPDRFRNQYLKIFDNCCNSQTILLKKRIPFCYRYERRCDYHPRYDRRYSMICFDSVYDNIRALCIMKLESLQ